MKKTIDKRRGAQETALEDPQELAAEVERLRQDVATYKHAFETTAADRDRLAAELATYKHAFETTAADRDRLAGLQSDWTEMLGQLVFALKRSPDFKHGPEPLKPPRAIDAEWEETNDEGMAPVSAGASQAGRQKLHIPNFYCVGAPKSGTSFIYSILRDHPKVHVAPKDEGNLIDLVIRGPDVHRLRYLRNANKDYEGQAILADFEVGFMMHEAGADVIHDALSPDARILFCLRDPVRRALSEYKMRLRQYDPELGGFRETKDFHEAVSLEETRRRERRYLYYNFYAYTDRGRYSKYIKVYFKKFCKYNVALLIMEEDFINDKLISTLKLFNFMSIFDEDAIKIACKPYKEYQDISRSPANIKVSFRLSDGSELTSLDPLREILARGVDQIEITSDVPAQLDLRLEGPSQDDVEAAYKLVERHAIALTLEQEKTLFEEHFADDVRRLEELIDRDLSIWYARYY